MSVKGTTDENEWSQTAGGYDKGLCVCVHVQASVCAHTCSHVFVGVGSVVGNRTEVKVGHPESHP